ncbi:MAG: DUF2911 domain-containing protein [Ferruginibacter sp.]
MIQKLNLRILQSLILIFISFTTFCQGVTTPRTPSPASELSQTIGISRVTVNYSRPSVKGREVWGKLVPYGWNIQAFGSGNSAPWRAGANENTTIHFSHDAQLEGKTVPAGTYGLSFVINEDNTGEMILSKDNRSWGSFFYDAKNDQQRSSIKIRDHAFTELLTYDFINLTKTSAELVLNWEKKQFPVKIEFDVDNIVMDNAAEELKSTAGFSWLGFTSAANYSLQNKTRLQEGLKYANTAASQNTSFNTLSTKANILEAMGNTTEAGKIMKDAQAIATNNELNAYGYQLMNTGQPEKAIAIFIMNTQKNPKDPNTFGSLGEAYFAKGDKKNAIINFKKALSMNPSAATKANSEKYLKQMGAL